MMKNGFILCLLSFFFSLNAQEIELAYFSSIDVSGDYNLSLYKSDVAKAIVNIKKGETDDMVLELNNGVLTIKEKSSWLGGKTKADIDIYFVALDYLERSRGPSIKSMDLIKSNHFGLDVSSGYSYTLALNCNRLDVDISSGASAKLMGETKKQKVDASNAAIYQAVDLKSDITKVDASFGASIKVYAAKKIEAEARSGSSVS